MILANPGFVARLQTGSAMNEADPAGCFGGTEQGYIDIIR